jgi:hypothetical protein
MRISIVFRLLMLSIAIFISNKDYAQCKTDLNRENLKGSVKKVIETGIYAEKDTQEINHIQTTYYSNKGQALGCTFASKYNNLNPAHIDFEFDVKGNRVIEKRYNIKNELENKIAYFYDAAGNEIESRFYNGDQLDNFEYNKYDANCNKTEYKSFYSDSGIWLWYTYVYENTAIAKVIDNHDSSFTKFKVDVFGNDTAVTDFNKNGNVIKSRKYKLEYDNKNNWIRKTTYINDKLYWIDERIIEYY